MNKNVQNVFLIIGIAIIIAGAVCVIVGFGNFANPKIFIAGGMLLFVGGLFIGISQTYKYRERFNEQVDELKQVVDFDKDTKEKEEEIPAGTKCKNCGATLKSSTCDYCGAKNKKEK